MKLIKRAWTPRAAFVVALTAGAVSLCGCSKADENVAGAAPATPAAPTTEAPTAAAQPAEVGTSITAPMLPPSAPPPPPSADAASWTPDALDELLAPIALYPEPVLAQVLAASTNSQEVLDAGNWLIDNETLKGDALTKAASAQGFSPAVQALVQFPTVVDMMCRELDWTKQLGAAFAADQGAVLASVQRLRAQAAEVGNLKSSPEMSVEKSVQEGKTIIEIKPADPQVVYVPQYNPTTIYAAAPATTTTTTTTTDPNSSGLTKNEAVMGGLLAFGAGILVANVFDDDDDDHYGYGYPNYGYGGVYYGGRPYYPGNTFVYAPRYPGYRPAGGYRPPGNYGNNYNNIHNTNVNINANNNYYNRFDKNQNRVSSYQPKSPVAGNRAVGSGYKGANTARNTGATAGTKIGQQGGASGAYKGGNGAAKVGSSAYKGGSGAYKGTAQNRQASPSARRETALAGQRSSAGAADRGYPKASGSRPDTSKASSNRGGGAFAGAGANQGGRDRAASQRGRSSMASAPRPSSQAHGGGGGRAGGGGKAGGGRGGR